MLLSVTLAALVYGNLKKRLSKTPEPANYEECIQTSGSILTESLPRQCTTKKGKSFTEETQTNSGIKIIKSKKIDFQSIVKSDGTSAEAIQTTVIKDQNTLDTYWDSLKTQENKPAMDFGKEFVVSVSQGQKPSGGHTVEVTEVRETDDSVVVSYTETFPGKNCIVTSVITHPYHIIKIPKTNKRIDFAYTIKTSECNQ